MILSEDYSEELLEGLDDFINKFLNRLDISGASLNKLKEELSDIQDNYYLRYESIPDMAVYHGWPDELYSKTRTSSLAGFIFLHSYEKMNVIPEETVLFYNLRDKIKQRLSKKYTIAKYIYTLGF